MRILRRTVLGSALSGTILALASVAVQPRPAAAIEAGEPAPEFRLPGTNGVDIALSDFRDFSRLVCCR